MVSLFSVIGQAFKPKTFAGLFGAAPSVAIASIVIAQIKHGSIRIFAAEMLVHDGKRWRTDCDRCKQAIEIVGCTTRPRGREQKVDDRHCSKEEKHNRSFFPMMLSLLERQPGL